MMDDVSEVPCTLMYKPRAGSLAPEFNWLTLFWDFFLVIATAITATIVACGNLCNSAVNLHLANAFVA